MDEDPFENVALMNKERDKAWEQLIKRKDIANLFTDTKFGFPLNGGFYDLWCIAWAKAWDKGFHDGWTDGMNYAAKKCAEIADTAEPYKSADLIRKHFGVEE
jgi:hypothetical protein